MADETTPIMSEEKTASVSNENRRVTRSGAGLNNVAGVGGEDHEKESEGKGGFTLKVPIYAGTSGMRKATESDAAPNKKNRRGGKKGVVKTKKQKSPADDGAKFGFNNLSSSENEEERGDNIGGPAEDVEGVEVADRAPSGKFWTSDSEDESAVEVRTEADVEPMESTAASLKRAHEKQASDEDRDFVPSRKATKTTHPLGAFVGLGAAKARLRGMAEAEWSDLEREADLASNHMTARRSTRQSDVQPQLEKDMESAPPKAFETPCDRIKHYARSIKSDAAKSKNLKGDIWGNINTACNELIELADLLGESDVVRSLKADNLRMRQELDLLRKETKALRTAFSERNQVAAPTKEKNDNTSLLQEMKSLMDVRLGQFSREIFISIGNMVNTRIENVEGRLPPEPVLRPPLAADKRVPATREVIEHTGDEPSALRTGNKNVRPSQSVSQMNASQTAASRVVKPATPVASARRVARPSVPPPAPPQESWATVARKKKPKGSGPVSSQPQQKESPNRGTLPKKTTAPKLVVPTMAAVVVALKPDAQTDYRSVMEKATTLKLAELGVDHLKVRKSAAGARIIEVPGEQSSQAADNLADRLRVLIGDVAEVYRPVKKAEIRISGFDESVTPEILKTEVAIRGKCQEDQVSVGAIRMAVNGSGSVIIRCPLTAAKVVVTAGRIMLGWSAARVEAMEQLPLRCYRCMGTGHTRPLCPSLVDRGDWCYRCSKPGHMSRECTALVPWCAVCHHAGLKAGHVMGGQACSPPPVRGKEVYRVGPATIQNAESRTEQQPMAL
ncbi:uncharacterized protein LOC125238161 [Leguminivora glycinivorella]|uniref:uncharacterized protein LOC125238161 n=1 Tax=Leguminivora glycinivorella TaxID=1035111 RepID=UPI00200BB14E|nr:uncharacterized protein LOC125238161 [Leguminivora glycinivorella]